jgi:protein-disulfide isomerase
MAGSRWSSLALALAMLAIAAPALALAQEPPPSDASSDQADMAPAVELKIDEPFGHAWLGAADADVTLVVFADYACPGCREIQPVIDQLLAEDPKLKIVYRILDNDQGGRTAALTSLAVGKVSADWSRFHHALEAGGDPDAKAIAAALAASGVAPGSLPGLKDDDADTLALAKELDRNDDLIRQRQGTGVPSWLIGDGSAQDGFDLPRLQDAIAKVRAGRAH